MKVASLLEGLGEYRFLQDLHYVVVVMGNVSKKEANRKIDEMKINVRNHIGATNRFILFHVIKDKLAVELWESKDPSPSLELIEREEIELPIHNINYRHFTNYIENFTFGPGIYQTEDTTSGKQKRALVTGPGEGMML